MNRKIRFSACFLAAAMMMSSFGAYENIGVSNVVNTTVVTAAETSVKILNTVGFGEGMYATWSSVSGASGYNVYVDGAQIDSMLIRQYQGYMRADAVGLKAGSHTMKVVPVINGKEDSSKAAETKASAYAHDRSGFGFVNGSSSGAYNDDGTLKSNALVVYVTDANKDNVTVNIDAGSGLTNVSGVQNILLAYKKGKETRPLCLRFIGNITDPANTPKGDLMVDTVKAGLTVEGIGNDAVFNGFGLVLKNSSNVEVRNIGFMNCNSSEGDNCGLQQANNHVWVHNCDFFYGDAGSDADQAKGDGALDTKTSTYITHSYNHFWDNGKCNLQGMKSESTENYITYHHNWYDHSDSRHPRIRTCSVHIYNNYFDGNAKYGVGVTMGASAFVDSNYFRNCPNPMMSSMQGTDAKGEGTFSGEDGGIIKSFNNVIVDAKSYVKYSDNNTSFDAYEVSNPADKVPSGVKTLQGGTGYNNFDTSSVMYKYTADAPADVPSVVKSKAGRVDGGDFRWQFDNAVDDASYAVNQGLKSALVNYKSSIVAIGSGFKEDNSNPPVVTTVTTSNPVPGTTASTTTPAATVSAVHNFTTDGASSASFSTTGSISTDKGTLTHNGLTLTKCLKLDSQGSLTFTASGPCTLTIVAKSKAEGGILKINGAEAVKNITMSGGVYTYSVPAAGTYTVSKGTNENYIYYVALSGSGTAVTTASTPVTTVSSAVSTTQNTTSTSSQQGTVTASEVIFCAPNGNGDGTYSNPASVQSALENIKPGGVIWLKGGIYKFNETIVIPESNSGTASAYKTIASAPGETAVFDFTGMSVAPSNRGVSMEGSYWHWYGVQIQKAGDNGMILSGSNNIIEMCVFNNNQDTGLQISRTNTNYANISQWPSNNLIKNCTAYDNCDDATMENADGFAAKLTCGEGNVFEGCMSYNNSDDGWDLYAKTATGPIGVVKFRNCIAFRNGYTTDGRGYGDCDGNGFKLGGSGVGTAHVLENCVAFENLHHGFTDNNNPKFGSLTSCTSYSNSIGGGKANFQLDRCTAGTFKNLLSYVGPGKCSSDKFNGNITNSVFSNSGKYWRVSGTTAVANSKAGDNVSGPTDNDFKSVKAPAMGTDFHKAWRNADGSINTQGFLEVVSSSEYASMGAVMSAFSSQTPTSLPKYDTSEPAVTTTTTAVTTTTTTTTTNTTTAPVTQLIYGDINGDGEVDMTDLSELSLYFLNEKELNDGQRAAADTTGDGELDIADLSHLKQYVSKKISWIGRK